MTEKEIEVTSQEIWHILDENNFKEKSVEELESLLLRIREFKKTVSKEKDALDKEFYETKEKEGILMEYFVMGEQNFRLSGDYFATKPRE